MYRITLPSKKKNWRREERRASVRGPEGWGLEIKVIRFYNMNYVAHICIFLKKCSFHVEQLSTFFIYLFFHLTSVMFFKFLMKEIRLVIRRWLHCQLIISQ